MTPLMQPLRDEHRELLPHVDALATAGDAVGSVGVVELRALVDEALSFLVDHLIPHATAEDRALYPVVAEVMGAPEATATMSRDHVEVDRLTCALHDLRQRLDGAAVLDGDVAIALRRALYGLYALVSVHFAKEEEVYVPLLEARLTPERASAVFARMHAEAETAAHRS